MMANLKKIQTFVIFDLETSNLPQLNFNKTSITEISISSISKDDLISNTRSNSSPRIINKLCLVFNPKSLIHPVAAKITGLDNYMLENENGFDDNAGSTILGFLKHLRPPICLIAHNGNSFDFPILKSSFKKLEMDLPENVYCVDSYRAFQSIDSFQLLKMQGTLKDLESELVLETSVESNGKSDEVDLKSIKTDKIDMQKLNETTPRRQPIPSTETTRRSPIPSTSSTETTRRSPETLLKRQRDDILGNHNGDDQETRTSKTTCNSRRELFPKSSPIQSNTSINKSPKGWYVLGNIYKRIFSDEPINAHHAEADVEMLQKIIIHYGEDFVEYAEKNAKLFSDVRALGSPQSRKICYY